jgi:hypothetical protein
MTFLKELRSALFLVSVSEINNHINNKLVFNLDLYYYVLECAGIYGITTE